MLKNPVLDAEGGPECVTLNASIPLSVRGAARISPTMQRGLFAPFSSMKSLSR